MLTQEKILKVQRFCTKEKYYCIYVTCLVKMPCIRNDDG